ncbi:MAG: DUF1045 domain-containing protein [Magnetovibrio sp.]|nr:DUF1045 domain-containing protein [Magnetovibrio sp.]
MMPGDMKLGQLPDQRQLEMTKIARHYGFHATLKPPFRTQKGIGFEVIDAALEEFAAQHKSFEVPALDLSVLDGFVALRPREDCKKLQNFAAKCVRAFDLFRLPPTDMDRAKHFQSNLSDRQKQNFEDWGYPYVMKDYRFHMTLTDRLQGPELETVLQGLADKATHVLGAKPWLFDSVTLVKQSTSSARFQDLKRYPLRSTSKIA